MSFSFKQLFQKESEEQGARGGLQFGETQAPPQAQVGAIVGRESPQPDPEGLVSQVVFDPTEPTAAPPTGAPVVSNPFEMAEPAGAATAPSPFAEQAAPPLPEQAPSPFAEQAAPPLPEQAPSPFVEQVAPALAAAPEPAAAAGEVAGFSQEVPNPFATDPASPNPGGVQEASPFAENIAAPAPASDSGFGASSVFFEPIPPSAREESSDIDFAVSPPFPPLAENADKGFVPLSSLPNGQQPVPDERPPPVDAQNPFTTPAASEPVQSPFGAAPADAAAQAPEAPASSPFELGSTLAEPAAMAVGHGGALPPFGQPLPSMVEPGLGDALPFAVPDAAPVEALPNEIELPLHVVVAELSAADLGFDPQQVPSEIKVVLGTASFASQWGAGPVNVALSEVIAGVAEQFRKAFANADPTLLVPLPQAELAELLPAPAPAPLEAAVPPSPLFEEIAAPAATAEQIPLAHAGAAPATPNQPFQPVEDLEVFEPATGAFSAGSPMSPPAADKIEPAAPFGDLQPPSEPAFAAPVELGAMPEPPQQPEPMADTTWPFGESAKNAPTPSTAPEPLESLSPLSDHLPSEPPMAFGTIATPDLPPAQAAPPAQSPFAPAEQAPAAPAEATPSPFADSRFSDEPEQSALRALFMVDGQLDAAAVVQHCSELIGIVECVAVSASGSLRASSAVGDPLLENAPTLAENVRALAAALGVESAGPLTVRSPQGLVSFFAAGDACLGVLHGDEGFQPGVQERLLLVAAELPSLL